MDKIKEIITTLDADDIREFRSFIHRQKKKKGRKDLELFELLQKKDSDKPLVMKKLLGLSNKEAYYAIRKRLIRHLTDFIMLKRMDADPTHAAPVMGFISLAKYLFDKKTKKLAWFYLNKAETLAIAHEQFDLLNNIYLLQIQQSPSDFAPDVHEIIKKHKANRQLLDEDERVIFAHSVIRQKLQERRLEGKNMIFMRVIHQVLSQYELTEVVMKRPRLLYNIVSILRSMALVQQDFYDFEPYIIAQYRIAEDKYGFSRHHHFYKLSLLYMIAHVLYRNRKFTASLEWLERLHEDMQAYNGSHYGRFYPVYTMLVAAIRNFQGRLDEAIALHEEMLTQDKVKINIEDELNARLSLGTYYAFKIDYSKAHEVIWKMPTDRICEKKMGKAWLLRKSMIEMLTQYELGNQEIALNRLRSIERYFSDFIRHPSQRFAKRYLEFLRMYMNRPHHLDSEVFYEKLSKFEIPRSERQSTVDLSFYCWLKAKVLKRPFYEVLLEKVNQQNELGRIEDNSQVINGRE